MKAKSRKRLLISSIAMLLVAMIALGTATFAWFTSSTTATANGIKVSTIKSSELQISKSNLAWGTQVDYQKEAVFSPTSSATGATWYTANAESKNSYAKAAEDNFEVVQSNALDGYVFTEALNIRNNGAADVENVTITISGLDCNYARLAIYQVTANNGTTASDNTKGFAQSIYGTLTGKNGETVTGIAYYKIFVWFEGQDAQCVDANAGASFSTLTNGLTFQVTGTTKTS